MEYEYSILGSLWEKCKDIGNPFNDTSGFFLRAIYRRYSAYNHSGHEVEKLVGDKWILLTPLERAIYDV